MNLTPLIDAISQHLPHDPVKALAVIIGGAFVIILVSAVTVQPVLIRVLVAPFEWMQRGRPVLDATEYNGPDIEFINSL